MVDIGKGIFNLQRMMILQIKVNPQTGDSISDDYAYAWHNKIYPFFDEGEIHENLEEYFTITKKQVDIISKHLDDNWLQKKLFNFYQLESFFKVRSNPVENIDRWVLIAVLRYMFLRGGFDKEFWDKILEPMEHPTEASGITRKFSIDEIHFE